MECTIRHVYSQEKSRQVITEYHDNLWDMKRRDREKQHDHQDINVTRTRGRERGTEAINMEGSDKGNRR